MIKYLQTDPWKIIEDSFKRKNHRSSESIFSIGNGRFGQRANVEELYSGPSLQGSYVAGVYYPDKTRVGWWKNGYPEYFAKVLNSTNWIGIRVWIEGEELDLAHAIVLSFRRELDMRAGVLRRSFSAELPSGRTVEVEAERFCSMADEETAAIRYSVRPVNFSGTIRFMPYLDGDVKNHDANYDERFWESVEQESGAGSGTVITRTRKTEFDLSVSMALAATLDHKDLHVLWHHNQREFYCENNFEKEVHQGSTITLFKYIGLASSLNYDERELKQRTQAAANRALSLGFDKMLSEQEKAWSEIWRLADITIDGDEEAQQGIRFNIFHLNQTYTGTDERLNIGPKGFTGEKYGGSTYWDTEAYCLPFYMATKDEQVARQLLMYRYRHLDKAIENARKLGFHSGAALYPMVTMNGEECHNEWEITFEEIHRNGAIAFAILNYTRYTGDKSYLREYGIEVLIGISRFWAQRVQWSKHKNKYVMLGVTGPNEYENNVNNNWYTNYLAVWTLRYTLEVIEEIKSADLSLWNTKKTKLNFEEKGEMAAWKDIIEKMHLPQMENSNIRLQQDGFLDKDLRPASDLKQEERPINQHWSWDRILRSCYIKQADVLQGIYFFEDEFSSEELKDNFDFYEPMTVHESSLSPCVHSILASRLGYNEKAYEMYMRTSRLDLDDYNHEAHEGLHITSMAGTWMSIVQGFGGMKIESDDIIFKPTLPANWKGFSFKIIFRGKIKHVQVHHQGFDVIETTA